MTDYNFIISFQIIIKSSRVNILKKLNIDIFKNKESQVIDLEKLSKFVKFQTLVKFNKNGMEYYYNRSFKKCQKVDFSKRGVEFDDQTVDGRICQDNDGLKEQLQLKNGYSNKTDRISF